MNMIKNIKLSKYDKKYYKEKGVSVGKVNSFCLNKLPLEQWQRACPSTIAHSVQFSQNLILLRKKHNLPCQDEFNQLAEIPLYL